MPEQFLGSAKSFSSMSEGSSSYSESSGSGGSGSGSSGGSGSGSSGSGSSGGSGSGSSGSGSSGSGSSGSGSGSVGHVCGPPPAAQYVVGVFENPSGTTHEGYAFINIPEDFDPDCHETRCIVTGSIKDNATIGGVANLSFTISGVPVQAYLSVGEGQIQVAYSVTSAEAPASLGYTGNPFEFRFYWVVKG